MFTKSEAISRLRELSEIITESREAYFNLNQSDVTDQEYDQNISEATKIIAKYPELEDEFKILNQIGAMPSSKFKKVKHLTPMYSLSNGFNNEDIFNFLKQIRSFLDLPESKNIDLVFEPKIDGLSLSLTYKNGTLFQALTRGDGQIGEDVTENARLIPDIPLSIPIEFDTLEVRGEVYFPNSTFKELNEELKKKGIKAFSNPRNAASGTLRQFKSNKERNFLNRPAMLSSQFDMIAGLPSPVGAYALAAQRHMYKYGSTKETLAEIAVAARKWASLNPNSCKKELISKDDVINSSVICSPLSKLDCCLVTDGGGALVISNSDRLNDIKSTPIYVNGFGETTSHSSITYMEDLSFLTVAKESSERAFKMSGKSQRDIDLAMIYDSFTITVLMSLEAIGFCSEGEGKDFVKNNNISPEGNFALNTNGGGLSYCHPGMYSIFTIIEACKQLWGIAGARQQTGIDTAFCHGTGGVMSSAASVIISKEKN